MPKAVSISFCKGKGSLTHNNRKFSTPNVDRDRTPDNIIYKQQPLKEAYAECFGAAIEEYDNKQKRADRKIGGIDGYMNKIKNSKNGEKLFYEVIAQIGTKYDCNSRTIDGEKARDILDEYMREFQERNPNLYVFNAVMHLDEETPHLHIDYIPVAEGYKQGMLRRNSLDKALKCQEISGKANKFENSTAAWQKRERAVLVEGIEKAGWEYKAVDSDRDDLTLSQYKAMVAEIDKAVAELPDEIEVKPVPFAKDKVMVSATDLAALQQRAKLSQVHEQATAKLEEKTKLLNYYMDHSLDTLSKSVQSAHSKSRLLSEKGHELDKEIAAARAEKEKFTGAYKAQLHINEINAKLYAENKAVKDENSDLKAKIKEQDAEIEIRVNKAVEAAVKPLKAKIDTQEQTISTMDYIINTLLQLMRFVRDRFAGKVSRAFLNPAIKRGEEWLEQTGRTADRSARVSKAISMDVVLDLRYTRGDEGKGLYDKEGWMVYPAQSISEAKEAFPKCKIKNEMEQGLNR